MNFSEINLNHFLILGTGLFFVGLYGFLVRRNMIAMLIGLELMLNGVNLNFAAFNRFLHPQLLEGMFFIVFNITIAAAEAALAIAIIINVYKNFDTINSDATDTMKF